MKHLFFTLLFIVCAPQAWAQTITQVTRHFGAGTGMVLETYTGAGAVERCVADAASQRSMCKAWIEGMAPPPPPDPVPPPVPPAPTGTVLHFSATGNDANPGTQALPKRNPASVDVNSLPGGSHLLLQRGGAWADFSMNLENLNATPTNPLVIDAYGTGAAPVLRTATGQAFRVGGRWGNTTNDGGYTIRNVVLDGMGTAERGLWFVQNVRGVTLDNVTIQNFRFGIESSLGVPHGVTGLTIRNSNISNNRSMGILGSYSDAVIEGSTFEGNNNITGSTGNHAIYFSHGNRVTIRNNTFTGNSVVNGSCIGGNVTVHGVVDGLLIEGNTIRQVRSAISCYGFAITAGYTTAESFRNVVVRGNTVINVGMTSIAANAAPGILVENNRVINTQAAGQYGIWIPANGGADAGDAAEGGAIVRNNTICFAQAQGSVGVSAPGAQASGNVIRFGADATTGACAL